MRARAARTACSLGAVLLAGVSKQKTRDVGHVDSGNDLPPYSAVAAVETADVDGQRGAKPMGWWRRW
ncbi:MAG: hypothetical protein SXG53_02830 [Pseudomonadota bacterium]|nr:hypothetical protein [Pseudomonadota bacterium]